MKCRLEKVSLIIDKHNSNYKHKYESFRMLHLTTLVNKQNIKLKMMRLMNIDQLIMNSSTKQHWNMQLMKYLKQIRFQSNLDHKSEFIV